MSSILIADDNWMMRQLLRAQLESLGADILEAADGQAALDLARTGHPRVAVLHLDRPKRNGFEVCAQLKADPATTDIRVAIMTASAEDDVQGYAFAVGAACFLTKPWNLQDLRQQITALLAGCRSALTAPAGRSAVGGFLLHGAIPDGGPGPHAG
jgi:CheY-like chemotaxis protein